MRLPPQQSVNTSVLNDKPPISVAGTLRSVIAQSESHAAALVHVKPAQEETIKPDIAGGLLTPSPMCLSYLALL
jgi:hypothetical protein